MAAAAVWQSFQRQLFRFAALEDDSDMKVVGAMPQEPSRQVDRADEAAQEYLKEKQNGNIAAARALGSRLAGHLIEDCSRIGNLQGAALVFFAVLQAVEEASPSGTVANTIRTSLFDAVKATRQELSDRMEDPGAFSFFMLVSRGETDATYGGVYAKCCGREGNPGLIRQGEEIFDRAYRRTRELVQQAGFQP